MFGSDTGLSLKQGIFDEDEDVYKAIWQEQAQIYQKAWYYFTGEVLKERQKRPDGKPGPLLYPLGINKVSYVTLRHATHLWGDVGENEPIFRYLVRARGGSELAKSEAQELQSALANFLEYNDADDMLRESARLFMLFGGIFFRVRYDPTVIGGLSLDSVSPTYVYPVWHPTRYRELLRVHVKFQVPADIAQSVYGYTPQKNEIWVDYVETWNKDAWQIMLGPRGKRVVAKTGDMELRGDNPFVDPQTGEKLIPFVYVSRLRTGKFYGQAIGEDLYGLQNEQNLRLADHGDAISAATHPAGWGRNLSRRGDKGPVSLQPGKITDLGDTPMGGAEPHVEQYPPPDISESSVIEFANVLETTLYDMGGLSPVLLGKDEGSQRSGQTLAMRAIPTIGVITDYRSSWRSGLKELAHLFIIGALVYKRETKIAANKNWIRAVVTPSLAPILPRDRESLVNEISVLRSAGAMSRQRAVYIQPDVENPEEELALIEAEEQAKRDAELEKQKQAFEQKKAENDVSDTRGTAAGSRGE